LVVYLFVCYNEISEADLANFVPPNHILGILGKPYARRGIWALLCRVWTFYVKDIEFQSFYALENSNFFTFILTVAMAKGTLSPYIKLGCFVCYREICGMICLPIAFLLPSKSSIQGEMYNLCFMVFKPTV